MQGSGVSVSLTIRGAVESDQARGKVSWTSGYLSETDPDEVFLVNCGSDILWQDHSSKFIGKVTGVFADRLPQYGVGGFDLVDSDAYGRDRKSPELFVSGSVVDDFRRRWAATAHHSCEYNVVNDGMGLWDYGMFQWRDMTFTALSGGADGFSGLSFSVNGVWVLFLTASRGCQEELSDYYNGAALVIQDVAVNSDRHPHPRELVLPVGVRRNMWTYQAARGRVQAAVDDSWGVLQSGRSFTFAEGGWQCM